MTDLINPFFCECTHCGEKLSEDEYESVCDEGCPSCRRVFEIDELE
jgi:phage FluMu protein Com